GEGSERISEMAIIKEGDKVEITYNNPFFWGESLEYMGQGTTWTIGATVLHKPVDVGDMWEFEDKDGTVFLQNPVSSNLDKIILAP
ncbi:MAG: hypothetical protein ACYC36_13340, partial [Bellilinea sp.]